MKVERTQDGMIKIDLWPQSVTIDPYHATELVSKLLASGVPLPVKPLEWKDIEKGENYGCIAVPFPGASYEVMTSYGDGPAYIRLPGYSGFTIGQDIGNAFEQAQAACQADYERRVKECIK